MGTIIGEGITFDDVLLVPQYSEVTPNMIDLKTHLTKKIVLNIPMMSAAMDNRYGVKKWRLQWQDRVVSESFIKTCPLKHRQMRSIR
mgnify:CR=1 FL=1